MIPYGKLHPVALRQVSHKELYAFNLLIAVPEN